jgi:hypothetical protein
VVYKREISNERRSCVRELEELGRCLSLLSCVREPVEVVRVFEEL